MAESSQTKVDNFPALEMLCETCKGEGGYGDVEAEGGWANCFDCSGSGYRPTPVGAKILELVRHNSKVDITAELHVSGAPP
jgi:DnaJ-class molecular chaperone